MKAVALLSGGLDSTLAVKLIADQGIEVIAMNFTSPFCLCNQKGKCFSVEIAKRLNLPLKMVNKGTDYLKILRKPKFGYGSAMNPCIDCRIYILKKAKKYAKSIGAKFIFTGEVLGERPMSQHMRSLKIIEKEAGLAGKLLRPLSAKLLPETEAEKKGLVDRSKLLAIKGRCRKPQIELASKFGIVDYPCPAGGCLLTYTEFANKVRDLFKYTKKNNLRDIEILKVGRHFRFNKNKIIVGRNEQENNKLLDLKNKTDYVFEVSKYVGPITILQGEKTKEAIKIAANLTASYSDAKGKKILVKYGLLKMNKEIIVNTLSEEEIDKLRI